MPSAAEKWPDLPAQTGIPTSHGVGKIALTNLLGCDPKRKSCEADIRDKIFLMWQTLESQFSCNSQRALSENISSKQSESKNTDT